MKTIKILGIGCSKCKKLFEVTEKTAKDLGIEYTIEKISDMEKILSYAVMAMPALVVDETVMVAGRVPSYEDLKKILS